MEELLGRKSSGFGLENRDSAVGIRRANYSTPLALTSSTSGGRSVNIVRSRTQAMDFFYIDHHASATEDDN
jgi:hypothetical protein